MTIKTAPFPWRRWFSSTMPDELARTLSKDECGPLVALKGVQQEKEWHPEGDSYEHTIHVVNAMGRVLDREQVLGDDREVLMLAALLHDVGKAKTTRWHETKQKWVAYGHDEVGADIALGWLAVNTPWLSMEDHWRVVTLVRLHMVHARPMSQVTDKAVEKVLVKLADGKVSWTQLFLLMEADCSGRPPIPAGFSPTAQRFNEAVARLAPGQEVDLTNWRPVVL